MKPDFLLLIFVILLKSCLTSPSPPVDILDKRDTLYFGFFFDAQTAKSLKQVTDSYFNATIEYFPQFSSFLQNITSRAGLPSIHDYFQKPLDPNTGDYDPLYHTTAKYCGNNQTACDDYEQRHSKFINQTFQMHLTGYVITNRTFGIRVNLSREQQSLFEDGASDSKSETRQMELTLRLPQPYPNIHLESQEPYPPPLPVTSTRAHITVGCAPGIPAVTTGPDALEAIAVEKGTKPSPEVVNVLIPDPVDPEGRDMEVILYNTNPNGTSVEEDYVFVLYPRVNVVANATLEHYFKKAESSASTLFNYYSYSLFRENSTLVMIATVFVNFFRQ